MKNSHDHLRLKGIQHLGIYFYRTVLPIQAEIHPRVMLPERNMMTGRIDNG